ncbi:beta-ketoacyl synthase N-terminal-like domain-containing protein [Streptomyces sp. LHD-70]|uniref:beta-ketoacyl-[acyl-carrier-protein] synthase family protein n=1 Tax=Streptomyces sp. LHD-70 TaxID=3072140 RepID=UPI0028109BF9|nr:beta-ketoacyl synthase N-terminal-like domain-containing protein [Streptomyces sp. LHD-70]MDQ8705982.1 beta-ketoacyl synthase N-terminal-like domain-containing protein [Streptomyces sp. LHD-70]
MRKVVITGVGLVLPSAGNTEEFWDLLTSGRTATTPIDRFPAGEYAGGHAGVVDDTALSAIPLRQRKRMDRFCALAMAAAHSALDDAGLAEEAGGPSESAAAVERTGVYLGNMYGGWEITEPSMRKLCQIGYGGVSPYIASAWFPTAPQGQISINWGFKGFSKTVAADTASGSVAVGYAARAVAEGRADVMLAGGAEAPVTPYTYTFCHTSGRLTDGEYRPFGEGADGYRVGEGGVVFVLEAEESALARGARPLAEIAGFATGHAVGDDVFGTAGAEVMAHVAATALKEAGVEAGELGVVGLDAQGESAADATEVAALRTLLGDAAGQVPCTTAKPATGHLLGAAPVVDLLAGLLAIRKGAVPPVAAPDAAATGLDVVTGAARERAVRSALVNARGADGTVAALALKAI